ncbi:hypothetical protein ABT218_16200, partial [Streptomyces sp. NPDC001455]
EWTDGCPVGTPALDGGSDVETVRASCAAAFTAMEQGFADLLTELGLPEQDATALATMVVAAYEGATLLARVRRSVAPLQTVSAQLEILIRAALNAAAAV